MELNDPTTTLRGAPLVTAPGKLFLIGEYAVLEGGLAVVAAVDRLANGQYVPGLPPSSPVIAEAVTRAKAVLGERGGALPPGSVLVNTDAFFQDKTKVGLGSSAAAAVAAAGAVFENAGFKIDENRDLLFAVAEAAHRAAQDGVGSGADVAASVYGGIIEFRRPSQGPVSTRPLTLPPQLSPVVFWTRGEARTTDMLGAMKVWAAGHPIPYERFMTELRDTAKAFVQSLIAVDVRGALLAADSYGVTLGELGNAAKIPIATPVFDAAADAARALGGTAKPSGAGGGDIGVALFGDPEVAATFARRCPESVSVLDVRIDPNGAKRRSKVESGR